VVIPDRQRPGAPPSEVKRPGRPPAPAPPPAFDGDSDESPFVAPKAPAPAAEARSAVAPARLAAVIVDEAYGASVEQPTRRRLDDAAVSKAIDVALGDDEDSPATK
jgi:hypothetical protein